MDFILLFWWMDEVGVSEIEMVSVGFGKVGGL